MTKWIHAQQDKLIRDQAGMIRFFRVREDELTRENEQLRRQLDASNETICRLQEETSVAQVNVTTLTRENEKLQLDASKETIRQISQLEQKVQDALQAALGIQRDLDGLVQTIRTIAPEVVTPLDAQDAVSKLAGENVQLMEMIKRRKAFGDEVKSLVQESPGCFAFADSSFKNNMRTILRKYNNLWPAEST